MRFSHRTISIAADVDCVLGCGSGHLVSCREVDDLEANIGLVRDARGKAVLFISLDALYVGPVLTSRIVEGLSDSLNPEQIFIGASHSHNAPMLDDTKPQLGNPVSEHVSYVAQNIIEAARAAISDRGVEVSIRARQYDVHTAVNRRRRIPLSITRQGIALFKVEQVPNLKDPLRPTSQVIDFVTGERVVGSLWVMPCHPTSYPNSDEVSSHYVGVVRRKIREATGDSSFPLMFFQGASGDLRPPAFSDWGHGLRGTLKAMFQPQGFGNFSRNAYESWCECVWDEYNGTRESQLRQSELETPVEISTSRQSVALDDLYDYEYTESREIFCQVIKLGSTQLVGLSAEATWRFREANVAGSPGVTLVGCLGDTFGYLASASQFNQGGYEACGFEAAFNLNLKNNVRPAKTLASLMQRTLASD